MKRLIRCLAAMTAACMLCPACPAEAPGGDPMLTLLEGLFDGAHNCAFSPVSLALVLSMAAEGASGETKDQLDALTGIPDAQTAAALQADLRGRGLRLAGAVFADDDLALRDAWREAAETAWDAEIFPLGAAEAIDAWVREKTGGLLDRAPAVPDKNTRLALLNAAAMDMKWALPFHEWNTEEDVFHTPAGDVTADFMLRSFRGQAYGERGGAQLLRLDYAEENGGMHMLLILPPEGGTADVLRDLAGEGLGYFARMAETDREIILRLPRTDITARNDLNDPLREAGVTLAFTDAADFGGIAETPLCISAVAQDVRLQIDEEGTRAAAVTEVLLPAEAALPPEEPVLMVLDRPFIVLIVDEETAAVCFAAVVTDPTGGK
ncbi:MAG: hypothetical protein IJK28_02590 [Clostridia bacterium]|nr:hypothetical protein [Clostridia bacterium]